MDKWKQDRSETGPSWNDVQEYLRDLSKTHSKPVLVEICLLPDNHGRTTYGLWVRVVVYATAPGGQRVERAKGSKWPHVDHRTMPALLLKLAHDLDWELEMLGLEALAQATF
jgi:hypothetical protein